MTDETITQHDGRGEKPGLKWQGHEGETVLLDRDGNLSLDDVLTDHGRCTSALHLLHEYTVSEDAGQFPDGVIELLGLIYFSLNNFHTKLEDLFSELGEMGRELHELRSENTKLQRSISKQKIKKENANE